MSNNNSIFIGLLLLVAGLLGLMLTPSSHQAMTGLMQSMTKTQLPKGISPTTLPNPQSTGANLLSQYCTQCHELPAPGMHTHDEWPLVIHRMSQYLNTMHTFHNQKPSEQQLQSILAYLQKHAQVAITKTDYADLATPPGIAFQKTCSQCHATPDPKQHTYAEWENVVQRMLGNMKRMGKAVPDEQQVVLITSYLQIHAK